MQTREKHNFIATFPAGCFEVISRQLKRFSLDELKIIQHDSSSVIFTSTLRIERLIELRFFTNTYLILDESSLSQYSSYIKGTSYRLVASLNGEPVSIDEAKRVALMTSIEKGLNLEPNIAKVSVDFVLMKRSGQDEVLTLRLPRSKHKREDLSKGALRPELANILLLVAGIKPNDVLLDPFAGYGSIPLEAVRGFGVKKVIAIEKEEDLVKRMFGKGFEVILDDASSLNSLLNDSIDKIVSDPPWGLYKQSDNLDILYKDFFTTACRVLKPKGIVVILSGSLALDETIQNNENYLILKTMNILVSGKKANIIKLQKRT